MKFFHSDDAVYIVVMLAFSAIGISLSALILTVAIKIWTGAIQ